MHLASIFIDKNDNFVKIVLPLSITPIAISSYKPTRKPKKMTVNRTGEGRRGDKLKSRGKTSEVSRVVRQLLCGEETP